MSVALPDGFESGRRCTVCGGTGHRADNERHGGKGSVPGARLRVTPSGRVRPATLASHATSAERRALKLVVVAGDDEAARPKTRGDCASVPRPCPFVSCTFNLYLDVNPVSGAIKLNHPDKEPWEVAESCCLDVADRNGVTLEEAGATLGVTRERARQIEANAIQRIQGEAEALELHRPGSVDHQHGGYNPAHGGQP